MGVAIRRERSQADTRDEHDLVGRCVRLIRRGLWCPLNRSPPAGRNEHLCKTASRGSVSCTQIQTFVFVERG